MNIETQIAIDVFYSWKDVKEIPEKIRTELINRIAVQIRKDRERAARIVEGAPLDVSLEQLAVLIREG